MPYVWLASTRLGLAQLDEVRAWLGSSELARLSRVQSASKQVEYLASRCLIRHALSARYAKPLSYWKITEKPNSAPTVDNAESLCYISLSHSADKIVVALDSQPLGVDIEWHRHVPMRAKIASRIFTQAQCTRLEEAKMQIEKAGDSLFFQFWTAKEAQYKALSQAGHSPAFFAKASLDDSDYMTQHFQREDFTIAIASQPVTKPWQLKEVDL